MWDQTLTIAAVIVLLAINAGGVVLTALQLPGPWLIVVATGVMAWWQWSGPAGPMIGWWALGGLLALAVLGEVVEFLGGVVGSSQVGGSKRAAVLGIVGAIVGAILGSVLIPILIVGTLVGAGVGAGVGSLLGHRWSGGAWCEAVAVGQGAAVGRVLGSVGKLAVAVVMWVVVLMAVLW
jgi:uncharacterized protein YqgC (DUF456 family)